MIRSKVLLLVTLAMAGLAIARDERRLPNMGPEWFARLLDRQTRIKALYELKKAGREKGEKVPDFDAFSAEHQHALVFPCPQPDQPAAWVVLSDRNWEISRQLWCGSPVAAYDPHPVEIERRRKWDAETNERAPDFKPWQVGQPWLEGLSGCLIDSSGRQLDEGFFAGAGVVADFDGDGMLDLFQVARYYLKGGKSEMSRSVDCLLIGPLSAKQPRRAMLFCNRREDLPESQQWRFAIRAAAGGSLKLVLVPATGNGPELEFGFHDGRFVSFAEKLPEGVQVNDQPKVDEWESARQFLKEHGLELKGVGSDDAAELAADRPQRPRFGDFDSLKWALPNTDGLAPRQAAQAIVDSLFAKYYTPYYERVPLGDPVPPALTGWAELWSDGGGWGEESSKVWWLHDGTAELWTQHDPATFFVAKVSVEDVGRGIAIVHELDRLRTVPKQPFAPLEDHRRFGGEDIPFYQVRAMTFSTAPVVTRFDQCRPSVWQQVGSHYDRDLAAVIATTWLQSFPEGKVSESRPIHGLAGAWLQPEALAKLPPALARAVVRAIGKNGWQDLKPSLMRLQESFGKLTESEQRLAELGRKIRIAEKQRFGRSDRDEQLAERSLRALQREELQLTARMTGDLRHELRKEVKEALSSLGRSGKPVLSR